MPHAPPLAFDISFSLLVLTRLLKVSLWWLFGVGCVSLWGWGGVGGVLLAGNLSGGNLWGAMEVFCILTGVMISYQEKTGEQVRVYFS